MKDAHQNKSAKSVKITPLELEREAKRLLPLLAKPGCRAYRAPESDKHDVFIQRRPGQKKPTAVCEYRVIVAFCRQDWLKLDPDRHQNVSQWLITSEGLAWLAARSGNDDAFRAQHQILAERNVAMPDGTVRPVKVNDGESPLGWLRRRKGPDGEPFLNEHMYEAGERLRADFTRAQLQPGITTDWNRFQTQTSGRRGQRANGASDLSDSALAARQRFESATQALGPELARVVVDVCCFMIQLGEAERARRWPQRSLKLVLRIALDILTQHYGMIDAPTPTRPRQKIHVWRQPGGSSPVQNTD